MSLPGLGIFTLDKSVVLPEESDRSLLSMPNAVQFQHVNIASADKELISFICEHTGKIKPLAISDLESYLNLGTEMLNIGKPFHLEGIGTITKNQNGRYDFIPGEYALIRENSESLEHGKREPGRRSVYVRDKKQDHVQPILQNRNLLRILSVMGALVIVAWGGWIMYKKASPSASETLTDSHTVIQNIQPVTADSIAAHSARLDSSKLRANVSKLPSNVLEQKAVNYKFVILATHNKPHALRRYNQLVSFNLNVHLYQKDSTYFKVYFEYPVLAKDTAHIKESLRREYAHNITIEP